jgi:hypothetical protein
MKTSVHFSLYLNCVYCPRFMSGTVHTFATDNKFGCTHSVIKGTLCEDQYVFTCILAAIWGILLKICVGHNTFSLQMMLSLWSVKLRPLYPKTRYVLPVTPLPLEGLPQNSTQETTHICYKLHKLGCNPSIIEDILHEDRCMFSPASQLPWEGFSWKFMSGTPHAFTTLYSSQRTTRCVSVTQYMKVAQTQLLLIIKTLCVFRIATCFNMWPKFPCQAWLESNVENSNNNVCGEGFRVLHPTKQKDGNPLAGGTSDQTELSAGNMAPLFTSLRFEAVMLKVNIWASSSHCVYVGRQDLMS